MRHYKLTDFRKSEIIPDTDLREINVTVFLRDTLELPYVLEKRLEDIINNLITGYEQENNIVIPLASMNLEICLSVQTDTNKLVIETFIGYDVDKEYLYKKEIVTVDDAHYLIIKKFFFYKLNEYVVGQIKRIKECVQ